MGPVEEIEAMRASVEETQRREESPMRSPSPLSDLVATGSVTSMADVVVALLGVNDTEVDAKDVDPSQVQVIEYEPKFHKQNKDRSQEKDPEENEEEKSDHIEDIFVTVPTINKHDEIEKDGAFEGSKDSEIIQEDKKEE